MSLCVVPLTATLYIFPVWVGGAAGRGEGGGGIGRGRGEGSGGKGLMRPELQLMSVKERGIQYANSPSYI